MPTPKWLSAILVDIRSSVVGAVAIAGGLSVWAAIKLYAAATSLGLGVALAVGAVVFACVVVVWNQLQQIDERRQRKRLTRRSPEDLAEQIRKWLWKYQFSVMDAPQPDTDFRMEANNDSKLPVTIVKHSRNPWVTVAAELEIASEHRPIVCRNSALLRHELTVKLIQLGVEYEIVGDGDEITRVRVNQSVWFDEATHDLAFLHAIMSVRRGIRLAAAMIIGVALAEAKEQKSLPSPDVRS